MKTTRGETDSSTILSWPLGSKTILWFAGLNKYLVTARPVDELVRMVWKGTDISLTTRFCISELGLGTERASLFDLEIREHLRNHLHPEPTVSCLSGKIVPRNTGHVVGHFKHYYRIYGVVFYVEFETEEIQELLHPKFAHLEISSLTDHSHHFLVFSSRGEHVLQIDGSVVGSWKYSDSHLLSGKFAMEILQRIYQRDEKGWLGVFHASAVTNGKNCILFSGKSGSGKSTCSALLMAYGFEVLADDFLPVESESGLVCSFPAAISVKKTGYNQLAHRFPELEEAQEFNNTQLHKVFRYLPLTGELPLQVHCRAMVFINYEMGSDFLLETINPEIAFQKLVPDSWISPESQNARKFVNWFKKLSFYQMTYSDNDRMIQTIKRMLDCDL